MARKFLTAPQPTDKMPPGVPYIVGNEAAERFSYYGMRGILIVFMTKYLMGLDGKLHVLGEEDAKYYYHLFLAAVYFFPLFGAPLADFVLGKYRTILYLSIVYCLGHAALAANETAYGLATGLTLVAIGSGGIKPCVSANVGDQFGQSNRHLMERVFGWFYWSINAGSFASTIITPILLRDYGPRVAFALPGIMMLLATIIFWLGRYKFVHIPPGGSSTFDEALSREGVFTLLRLGILYVFVAVFWALYDQTSSTWILQAERMNRHVGVNLPWIGEEPEAAQFHSLNPIMILVLMPFFAYVVYPAMRKIFRVTPLRKIGIGLFVTAFSFVVCALVERWIQQGYKPSIAWQALAYVIITSGEVMVSITILEFSYTQAPPRMKSLVMAINLFSVSMGNALVSLVTRYSQNESGKSMLPGAEWFWFWAKAAAITGVAFIPFALLFREQSYVQAERPADEGEAKIDDDALFNDI